MYRLYCILSAVSIIMINQKQNKGKQNIGSFLLLPAYGRVGQGQHFLAAYFAKRNTKNCGGEKARAGREFIFPTPLFLPAPSERKLSKFSVGIFAEKSSDFVQDRQPICKVCVFPLARGFASRFGRRIFKQFPNESILFVARRAAAKRQFSAQKRLQI